MAAIRAAALDHEVRVDHADFPGEAAVSHLSVLRTDGETEVSLTAG
jgi:hypothetical protein